MGKRRRSLSIVLPFALLALLLTCCPKRPGTMGAAAPPPNYLIRQGVRENRITLISYGKERPMCSEHDEDCWAKNRRAHFLVKMQ